MIALVAALLLMGVFFGGRVFQSGYIKLGLALAGACSIGLEILLAVVGEIASREDLPQLDDQNQSITYNDDIDWRDW